MRNFLVSLGQDVRFAWRTLRKNRGFAVTAVLTLAISIGANAAIYAVVDAVVLHPLPFSKPDRLVVIYERGERNDKNSIPYLPSSSGKSSREHLRRLELGVAME